jgi:hypothetical protein
VLLSRPPLAGPKADPSDLHVLGTPPAFTLSQDQTLHQEVRPRSQSCLACAQNGVEPRAGSRSYPLSACPRCPRSRPGSAHPKPHPPPAGGSVRSGTAAEVPHAPHCRGRKKPRGPRGLARDRATNQCHCGGSAASLWLLSARACEIVRRSRAAGTSLTPARAGRPVQRLNHTRPPNVLST